MEEQCLAANPFAQMLQPQELFEAMENSPALNGLERRICKPLEDRGRGMAGGTAPQDNEPDDDDSLDDDRVAFAAAVSPRRPAPAPREQDILVRSSGTPRIG